MTWWRGIFSPCPCVFQFFLMFHSLSHLPFAPPKYFPSCLELWSFHVDAFVADAIVDFPLLFWVKVRCRSRFCASFWSVSRYGNVDYICEMMCKVILSMLTNFAIKWKTSYIILLHKGGRSERSGTGEKAGGRAGGFMGAFYSLMVVMSSFKREQWKRVKESTAAEAIWYSFYINEFARIYFYII